ncbi:alpha/beta hydrolase [Salipiger pacificus]|nr:alpha/beta hydrolase [Alloyangia pacifica]
MDYRSYLSPEIVAFVDETNAFYPEDLDPRDWPAQRAVYDRMAAHFHRGRPEGLAVLDCEMNGVPVRLYGAVSPVTVVYAHGGGLVLGGLESHDDVCAEMAQRTGCRVVSVDYRLAPENPWLAAYEDLVRVVEVCCVEGPVILCGDSAGASLCATVSGTRADLGLRGQVLVYPGLGYPHEGGSFEQHAEAPLLSARDLGTYREVLGGDPDDPRLVPAKGTVSALPPTWLFPAECDPLHDDALRYAEAARAAGAEVHLQSHAGLVHGWLRARDVNDLARDSFSQIVAALVQLSR